MCGCGWCWAKEDESRREDKKYNMQFVYIMSRTIDHYFRRLGEKFNLRSEEDVGNEHYELLVV